METKMETKTETKMETKTQTKPSLQISSPIEQLRLQATNYIHRYPLGKPSSNGEYDSMLGPLPFANHMGENERLVKQC